MGPMDALVLVTGTTPAGATNCRAHVSKPTFDYAWRDISGNFRLDYVANPGNNWIDVEIECDGQTVFSRRFDGLPDRINVGQL